MNVLLIGGGGREHALARALSHSPDLTTLYATHTTNPGIASLAKPVPFEVSTRELYRLQRFCESAAIDLVVIGPEGPLADGYADALAKRERSPEPRPVFGPTKLAARLESDKGFAKQLMRSASIPTPDGRVFDRHEAALTYLESREDPPVIKACGLAKGKGVFVPATLDEARDALHAVMVERRFGDAGDRVLIEERLAGREVSAMALVDGNTILMLPHCQDYKRLGERDTGPNTGGMGSICPAPPLDDQAQLIIERDIMVPTVAALRREGIEFRGVLYAGLMLTVAGPEVLEFNVRFGDPECQTLLARLPDSGRNALTLMHSAATGTLDQADPSWTDSHAICLVLACEGYPDNPRSGSVIHGLNDAESLEGVSILHAGTTLRDDGSIITSGGRVLNIVATADSPGAARERAYRAADLITFPGKQVRRDIGLL